MQNIFVLEDDQELRDTIRQSLQEAGYRVFAASSIREGKDIIEESAFDLAVLDVNLPDGDGFAYCRWLRQKTGTPVLFLSARDLEEDQLCGYDSGAEDYVTKPFSMKVLLKKVSLILARENKEKTVYDDGFLRVDLERGVAERDQEYFQLTPTEQRIVKKFIENRGRLLTYQSLLDALWDEGSQFLDKHTLAVNINRLRKKLEDEQHTYITNVYGMGYLWK